MKVNTQEIRRSQLILTYGPGAIIESIYGPRLIKSTIKGMGRQFSEKNLEKYEIENDRLCTGIRSIVNAYSSRNIIAGEYVKDRDDVHIFSPISNIEMGDSSSRKVSYSTLKFPEWKICYGKSPDKKQHDSILYDSTNFEKCPLCNNNDASSVRFVMACRRGHLDNVTWKWVVHKNSLIKECDPDYYFWKADGVSLATISIRCPECQSEVTMNDVYNTRFDCTGKYHESSIETECDEYMHVMQRQASSLYLPLTIMLVKIPEYDSGINNLFNNTKIFLTVNPLIKKWKNNDDITQVLGELHDFFNANGISEETYIIFKNYLMEYGIEKLKYSLEKFNNTRKMNFIDFIDQEFDSLLQGPRNCENFVMGKHEMINSIDSFPALNVYPVNRLKTTTVQIGYTRKVSTDKKNKKDKNPKHQEFDPLVSSASPISSDDGNGDDYWYPGFVGVGEGIFITFSDGEFTELKNRKAYNEWYSTFPKGDVRNTMPGNTSVTHPLYVWLHTLSHAIINVLSLYSGYSSASMRERIYVDRNQKNGGILIYTSAPSEDGGMGGLSGLVTQEKLQQILAKAKERIDICSNDPLCLDIRKDSKSQNGAACYSCILISETSCEQRNMFLDRHLITGD